MSTHGLFGDGLENEAHSPGKNLLHSKRQCCQNKSEPGRQRRRRKVAGFPGPQLGWARYGSSSDVMVMLLWGWSCCWVRAGNHSLGGTVGRVNVCLSLPLFLLQT